MSRQEQGSMGANLANEAAHWYQLNREGHLAEHQRVAFLAWMKTSPEHVREYLRALHLDRQVSEAMAPPPGLAQGRPSSMPARALSAKVVPLFVHNRRVSGSPARRSRRGWRMVAAIAGLSLLLGALLPMMQPREHVLAAGHGQLRDIVLSDKTRIRLNAESSVRVQMGWFSRRVELLKGEATFDVAPNPRPFEVRVDRLLIRDIGTVFDVSRRLRNIQVGVVSGSVEVWGRDGKARRLADLHAGQVVQVERQSQAVQTLQMPAAMLLSWQAGKVSFVDERLDEVVVAFNRHNTTQLVIGDERAASTRISVSLDAGRVEALQAFLERDPRLMLKRTGHIVRVTSR